MTQICEIASLLRGQISTESQVTIRGWVRTTRHSKAGFSFIAVHDGSSFDPIQVVVDASLDHYEDIQRLTTGCAVICHGTLVESQGKGQSVEIQATKVEIVGWVEDPNTYPMQPKRHSMEFLRENAHLRPRTNLIGAVARVRNTLAQATHRFFAERGFAWIHTPLITTSDCEGGGENERLLAFHFS